MPRRQPTRRELLAGGVAMTAAGGLLAGVPGALASPSAAPPLSEADRIARLISVEMLMLYVYDDVLAGPLLKPRARRLLDPLRGHEAAHIRTLSARLTALGGVPPLPPTSVVEANRDLARRKVGGRLGQLQGGRDALRLLLALEQVVVGAYFVALTALSDPKLITLAAQIMASEAQHEALVGEALYPGNAQNAVPYGLVQGIQ
jgi:hypothetical protein